jgi:hypothetical protein
LTVSQQLRVRRSYGSRAYDDQTKEFRAELSSNAVSPGSVLALVRGLVAESVAQ